ncbi:MAG: ribosome biogenesis GTPase YlqF [bacterium]|nr:ribosome biogenesis GTPase YlqF [Gammaproteobacteria bacterium]HIL95655.1 ribosome biogenesis GTPase YlqF [Pseudomonadales bacterium]
MAIHWYPGHMHKANKDMLEVLPQVDLIIELLDARLPYSSQNPNIATLRENKPCIKILSKSDLADPDVTALWQSHFEQQDSVKTLLTTLEQTDKAQKVVNLCLNLVSNKANTAKLILAMITGIPNVGKSTLINALAGRAVAKTGNEPAVTKGQQKINLRNGIMLLDTPGILWPKIHNEQSGYRLATTGAIKDTSINHEEVAFFAADFFLKHYPHRLQERFEIPTLPETELEFLELLGARRGCLRAGGQVDLAKVSTILLNEIRSGKLGRITMETPEMVDREIVLVEKRLAEKAESRTKRKRKKKR